MTTRWSEEVPRLARLAKLPLAPEQAARLAEECEAIARSFSDLADHAATLPDAPAPAMGALRADEAAAAAAVEVDGILAAAPRVDARTRAVLVPRGER